MLLQCVGLPLFVRINSHLPAFSRVTGIRLTKIGQGVIMRKLYYAIAFTALIGLPGIGTAAISATAAHAHHQHITVGDNCLAHRDEVQLTTLETHSFGSDHAAEHARARAERCTETSEAPQANYLSQAWQPLQSFFNRAMAQLNRLLIQITVPANAATG